MSIETYAEKKDVLYILMSQNDECERLRAIIEFVVDGIITISEHGLIEAVNPATETIFGYSTDEILNQNISKLMPEPPSNEQDRYIMNFLTSEEEKVIGQNREHVGRRKDGSTFAMELMVNEMKVAGQRKFIGIVRDISQRKLTELALKNNEERFRAICAAVSDSIVTINEHGVILAINQAVTDTFDYMAEELIGENITKLMPEPYISFHDSYLNHYMDTGDKKVIDKGREVEGRRKNGSTFPIELAVNEIQIEGKRMFTGILRDITGRKRIDKMREEFVATISHELRTPLTSIRGSLGLLNSEKILNDKPNVQRLLKIAESNTSRLLVLISDLLDFQNIQTGKMNYNFSDVNLLDLVSNCIEINQSYANEYKIKLRLVETIKEQTVIGDVFRLGQVITNLLSNAIKFSTDKKQVDIGITDLGNKIKIYIRDYGLGISEDFQSKIFEEFSQSDHSNTRKHSGTGLGLNISKSIIDFHGGEIYYESVYGEGAVFSVELIKNNT